jgi:hypothetical protein
MNVHVKVHMNVHVGQEKFSRPGISNVGELEERIFEP